MARTKQSQRKAASSSKQNMKTSLDAYKAEQKAANPRVPVKEILESWNSMPADEKEAYEKKFQESMGEESKPMEVEEAKGAEETKEGEVNANKGKEPIVEEPPSEEEAKEGEEDKPAPVSSSSTPSATPPDAVKSTEETAVVSPSEADPAPENILVPGTTGEPSPTKSPAAAKKRGRPKATGNGGGADSATPSPRASPRASPRSKGQTPQAVDVDVAALAGTEGLPDAAAVKAGDKPETMQEFILGSSSQGSKPATSQ